MRRASFLAGVLGLVGGLLLWYGEVPPTPAPKQVAKSYGRLPLSFEVNRGQTDGQVKFLSRGRGYTLFLTPTEAVLALKRPKGQESSSSLSGRGALHPPETNPKLGAGHSEPNAVLRMKLLGANPDPQVVGLDELPGKSNYFIGNDPKQWRTNVPSYRKVGYKEVYPGIDLVYYGTSQRQLEYDFVVAPGADPSAIRLRFDGADSLSIDSQGDLVLELVDGEVRFLKPVLYQEAYGTRQEVAGRYVLESKNEVAFEVTSYDASQPLVIDPVLGYSTYLGGTASDQAFAIAVDDSSNVYVTGWTNSVNFPTTVGAFQPSLTGTVNDIFVAKLNASGSALVYSTYLGGNGGDLGISIAVDAAGNAYITGNAGSLDFPTTPGAFQVTFAGSGGPGGGDAFVTKLSAAGDALVYSTYLGGSEMDRGESITADPAGNAYVTGFTNSSDFPTAGALQASFGGCFACSFEGDAFVTKLSPAGTVLVYSTYLGGSGDERGFGLAVDATGNAYVTGFTTSTDFPTANALQATPGLFEDVFVAKLNATGSALTYSTYLGGGGPETGFGITLDALGNAYVTGETSSGDFPTANSFQASYGGGFRDAFVTKLNAEGSSLVYSTYLGGSDRDHGWGIAVDAAGNAYVTGMTLSMDFPTANPVQAVGGGLGGFEESFVTKLNAVGSALVYSTYLGGSNRDNFFGGGIMVDTKGNAYVTGNTPSDDFPTTNPFQASLSGGTDAFVAKICGATPDPTSLSFADQVVGTASPEQTATLTNLGSIPLTITSIVTSGDFNQTNTCAGPLAVGGNCTIGVTFTPTETGTRTGDVTITDDVCGNPYTVPLSGTGLNPVPMLSSLSPSSVIVGGQDFTVTVSGSDFVAGSVVRWNGTDRTTTFVGSGELQAAIPASDIAVAGTADVTVFNPPPGGGTSNALTFGIADFAVGVSPASVSVTAGQSASYTVSISPQGGSFDATVSLSCSNLPGLSSCSFSPSSLTPGGSDATSTLTVSTTAPASVGPGLRFGPPPRTPVGVLWLGVLALALLGLTLARRAARRQLRFGLALGLLAWLLVLQVACGGGGETAPSPPPPRPGTPTGTFNITITGTAGSLQHSTTATLVVQ